MLIRVAKGAPPRGRPRPSEVPEIRSAERILDRNEGRFSRAFLKAMRALNSSDQMKRLKRAIRSGEASIERILDSMLWYNEADPESVAFWTRLVDSAASAYLATITESAESTFRRYKFPVRFEVEKAAQGTLQVNLLIPIAPASIAWMRSKSASLVKDISASQRKRLRGILFRNFERGVRPEAILSEIEATVGLTEIQTQWVLARQDLALARGVPKERALSDAQRFADKLLKNRAKTIARTETVDAHTKGLTDAWQAAKDNGFMRPGTTKVWQAMMDERTSDICEELDGQEVLFEEAFESSIVGPVDRPPAHPNCRSTLTLRFPR